ncbi:fimbrial protein, partial [Proteus mirabilis]
FIYIKGSFLNAPCELISNEISLKELYIKDIDVVIGGCNIYSDFKNSSNSKPAFTSVLSFTNKINDNVENIDIRMNRLKHYKDNVILNYLFSDEIKRNILDRKLNILTLKLQYN